MKRITLGLTLILTTLATGCAWLLTDKPDTEPAPPVTYAIEGASTIAELEAEIEALIEAADHGGKIAICVEQRDPGREIINRFADDVMVPASNNKLQTTATAMHHLGPDMTRTTRLMVNGTVDPDGVLNGDLIVVGDGDPTISGRFNGGHILASFEDWAEQIQGQFGITTITGDVIGDDDLFNDIHLHDSWWPNELGEWYCAENSALNFNDNCVDLMWTAGESVGDKPTFTENPDVPYLTYENNTETKPEDASTDRYYYRDADSRNIVISGGIQLGREKEDSAAVDNPTLYTVTVITDVLRSAGITVQGEPKDIDDLDRDAVHENAWTLIEAESPTLLTMVDVINQRSQNLYADVVLKTLGVEVSDEGSFAMGAAIVEEFLAEIGALPEQDDHFIMIDGSGLSPLNRTTPRCLVTVLRHMDTEEFAAQWRTTLPRGQANRGSLRNRFAQSDRHLAVAPGILGKTGYIDGMWCLSGVIDNQAGEEFYYSIMLNDYTSESVRALRMIDDLAVAIAASTIE